MLFSHNTIHLCGNTSTISKEYRALRCKRQMFVTNKVFGDSGHNKYQLSFMSNYCRLLQQYIESPIIVLCYLREVF
jgi:hypothetical protein